MKRILPVIVLSQFFCTSVWFAVNAVMPAIGKEWQVPGSFLVHLASAVQFGFITGTLLFAILAIADRISPSRLFFICALLAAVLNLLVAVKAVSINGLLLLRFSTGFFLAGIYPVGMKIAADHYDKGLGKSLGYLVGALVLGTAFPHFLHTIAGNFSWRMVIYSTSILAATGGIAMVLLVPDGRYRKAAARFSAGAFVQGFRSPGFRAAAYGYFGHMWELYAFWVFVPMIIAHQLSLHPSPPFNPSLLSFFVIASGCIACIISGLLSRRIGARLLATTCLFLSACCCIASPLVFSLHAGGWWVVFLFAWGVTVIADSPLFSTLIAQEAPVTSRGASLTIVNCIGFTITIFSIQLMQLLMNDNNFTYIFMLLAVGPVLGLIALLRQKKRL